MWKQSSWQIIRNEIHRFPMNVKLHSSFILKVSHLFISSLISEKNNIWCRRFWILSRVSQKMELPLLEHSLGKFHNDDIVLSKNCFLQYSKNVPKIYWYIDFDKVLYLLIIEKMQFVHNIVACLKNRQVSNYQPLAFELKAFCLGTPVAFPQHVLLDFNKQIAQITQRQL